MKHSNKLILGSQSPRRKELLEKAGFTFDVLSIDFEEVFSDELAPVEVAEYLAIEKNKAYRNVCNDETVITADTVVIADNKILGKPKDGEEAMKMLQLLSGRTHLVASGVAISSPDQHQSFSNITEVKVKLLSTKEIAYYVDGYGPMDKAGAYGIQEWFGLTAVEWIKGSYFNVVGLPIHEVYEALTTNFGISPIDV